MWVWTSNEATAPHGTQRACPSEPDHQHEVGEERQQRAWACQMSISSSLPITQVSAAHANSINAASPSHRSPGRRPRATTTTALSSPTPIAAADENGSSREVGAMRSSYIAPGLFMFSPTLSDADVHEPSSGW